MRQKKIEEAFQTFRFCYMFNFVNKMNNLLFSSESGVFFCVNNLFSLRKCHESIFSKCSFSRTNYRLTFCEFSAVNGKIYAVLTF